MGDPYRVATNCQNKYYIPFQKHGSSTGGGRETCVFHSLLLCVVGSLKKLQATCTLCTILGKELLKNGRKTVIRK